MSTPQTTAPPSIVHIWMTALRPRTLAAGSIPVIVGAALSSRAGKLDITVTVACLLGALLLQVASNFANDAFDSLKGADTDARVGPARATQRGWVSARQMLIATAVVVVGALLVGGWLVSVGGWPIALIGVSGAVCAVAYTGGPIPLGYIGLGDVLVYVYFGLAAVMGTVWVQTPPHALAAETMLAASAIGALATAILVVNNLRDRHTDAACGKRTLAVRLGSWGSRMQWSVLVGSAYVAVAVAAVVTAQWGWLLPVLTLPLALRTGHSVWKLDGAALNPLLGGTARLETVFGALLAVGVLL